MAPTKSPPWVREEIILALEHYIRDRRRVPEPTEPSVILISHQLNQLPLIPLDQRAPNFRNPNGVVLKIANLRAFDPLTTSKGMSAGSRLDREIFEEFLDNPRGLFAEAADIRLRYGLGGRQVVAVAPINRVAAEPEPIYRVSIDQLVLHERLEQDVESRAERLERAPVRACEVCGFDFGREYGVLGEGYIQFHHRALVESLTDLQRPTASDLHLVCANCHAMLHAAERPLTVEKLKAVVRVVQRERVRDLASKVGGPRE